LDTVLKFTLHYESCWNVFNSGHRMNAQWPYTKIVYVHIVCCLYF
jgi:hypothetical protein